jgi:dolichol kinase
MSLPVGAVALLLVAAGQLCVLGAAEAAHRRGLGSEQTRRLAHAVGAATVALLPFILSLRELGVLAVLFTVVLAWAMRRGWLRSVHGVDRPTVGALVFPAGLFLGAWVGWGHPAAVAYAALVLALADPVAALAGERLGGSRGPVFGRDLPGWRVPGWRVPGGAKTAAGSAAFCAVTLVVGAALTGLDPARLPRVLAAAAVLTAVEGSIGYGLDNLPLPPLASLLAMDWLLL